MTLTSLTTDFSKITGWAQFPKILFGHVSRAFQKGIIGLSGSNRAKVSYTEYNFDVTP